MMTFSLFADTTKQAIPDSTKVTMVTIYNDAKEAMKGLGAALKVGSEHVYEVLIKQQVANAIIWTILGLIPLICLLVFAKSTWKWAEENYDDSSGFTGFVGFVIIGTLLVLSIIGFCHIDDIITGFVNPEYGALKEIMEFIKK